MASIGSGATSAFSAFSPINQSRSLLLHLRGNYYNAATLRRIEENDPSLIWLVIGGDEEDLMDTYKRDWGKGTGIFSSFRYWNTTEFDRVGRAIGGNTHLKTIEFVQSSFEASGSTLFFQGIKQNSSFRRIILHPNYYHPRLRSNLSGFGSRFLTALHSNKCVTNLEISSCICTDVDFSFLSRLVHLKRLSLDRVLGIDTAVLEEIILIIRELRQLKELVLRNIRRHTRQRLELQGLMNLLLEPNCNISILDLSYNVIGDGGVALIASALRHNKILKTINLKRNEITPTGWESLSHALCDTSSITDTYSSNHILYSVPGLGHMLGSDPVRLPDEDDPFWLLPANLMSSLIFNQEQDKKLVAMKKILFHHPHFNMEPYFEHELKMLPLIVDWFSRASVIADYNEFNADANKLFSIYQFVCEMPLMFVPRPVYAGSKRKRG